MVKKITYLFLFSLIVSSSFTIAQTTENKNNSKILTKDTIYVAGSEIILKFSDLKSTNSNLYCSGSYGSTLIKPSSESGNLYFKIPSFISNKAGILTWKLLHESESLSGQIEIIPKKEVNNIESYIGPPSIQAGNRDFSMIVVIPEDPLDNPLEDNTQVDVKYQFLDSESIEPIYTNNLIAFKNIYSQNKTGRYLVSSECLGVNSKEFDINVMPSNPTNFKISFERHHDYADGNQITTFSTSIIRDEFNNIISDGTFVEFFIKTKKNAILKTSGNTVNGIATAKMIHPDYDAKWEVKAFIEGMAESNPLALNYKRVITDYEVVFSKNYRHITVGPLQSFMKQIIPDGLLVELSVYKNGKLLNVSAKTSNQGFASFVLNSDEYPDNTYTLKIKTAGIEKSFNNIKLW
jgi:hypothetical protein